MDVFTLICICTSMRHISKKFVDPAPLHSRTPPIHTTSGVLYTRHRTDIVSGFHILMIISLSGPEVLD